MMKAQTALNAKEKILQTAKNLFWKHGIRRVSIKEICKEAAISKVTFYRHFENKSALAFTLIDNMFKTSHIRYRDLMDNDLPFAEKVTELVKMKQADVAGISQEMVKDIYDNEDEALKKQIDDFRQKMLQEVMQDFAAAQKKGEIRKDIKLEFILYELQDLRRKACDEALLKLYNSEEDLIMELTNFFFYGLLTKNQG